MQKTKHPIWLITYGLILYFILRHFSMVIGFWRQLIVLISPFIWGFALAYLLNIPYSYILNHIFKTSEEDKRFGWKKGIAVLLTYVLFFFIITFSVLLLFPQISKSINEFLGNFSGYYNSFEGIINNFIDQLRLQTTFLENIQDILMSYKDQLLGVLNNLLPSLVNVATGTASGIFNVIFTLILSVYFLVSKDMLVNLIRRSFDAFASARTIKYLDHVIDTSNTTFRGFIIGQLTDALIVGIITFVGSSLFGFPYPMLLGFIAGLTNIIPVLGPFIGAVPCIFIILMAAPSKVIWYIVFVVVLQQIDGNFICPKIVGDSIGLDGIWVIFAVLVGGGLFGIAGSFLCVPVFAILLKLYNEWIDRRALLRGTRPHS